MAGNGVNLGVGIDLSQFQKDISYVNKELKDISKLEVVAKMKIGLPKGKLKKEVEEAQKELDVALNSLKTIKRNGTPIELFNMKDIEKEVKRLGGELKKATAAGNKYMENRISSEIAKLNNVVIAAGKMSDVMSKAGLSSTPKSSAINKSERAELGEQIKLLQKKRDLLTSNASIDESSKLKEDKRLLGEIVKLEERREATYKSGSSKAGLKRLNAYREESLGLDRAELDRQIKQLEKRRELLRQDFKLSSKDRLNEERKIIHQIIGLLERREATYKSGSSKAGQERLSQLRQEASALKQQGTLFGSLGRFAAQYFSLYSAWNVVKQIFDVTKELQRQQVALEGIVGSAVEATKALNGLKAMALESPFNLKELIGYTKQLAAYGIEVEELLPTTSKLADLSAGLGVDMSRLILAYGQVNAASVLRGQELRQFTEAGVPLVDKLAQKFSDLNGRLVTTGEVFDMISKRQVSFEMVSQVLTDMTSEGGEFYKMQENLTGTLYGQFEKLKDTWTISLKGIGDEMEGVFRTALKLAMDLSKNLGGVILAISSAGIGKALKSIVSYLSVATKSLGNFIIRLKLAIKHSYGILYAFRSIGKALISNAGIAALSMIIGLIVNAVRKSKEWEREINKINESFAKDTAKLTVGFDKLVNKISTASENTKEFADAVSTLKSNYGDFVNDNIVQALINEARAAKEAGNEYRALAESIKASIEAKKEYERHETLKNTAAEQIMGQLNVGRIFNVTRSELAKKRETRKSEISSQEGVTSENLLSTYRDDEQLMKIYRAEEKFRSNDLESAVSQAIAQMTSNNETTRGQFSSRFEEALKTYGFNEVAIEAALGQVDELFGKIEGTDQWKTYLSEVRVISNDATTKIREAFEAVDVELSGERYKSIVGDRKGGNYNPLAIDKEEQRLYIEKYTGLLKSLLSPEQFNKLAADKGYQEALKMNDEDYGKGKALREAIFEYQKTLVSPQKQGESDEDYEKRKKVEQDVFNTIQNISNAFLEFAGTIGETADGIRSNGAQLRGFEKLNLSSEEKDMLTPYLKVTEENVEQQQKALWSELDRLDEFIKKNENNEQFKGRVDDAKRIKDILTVLTDKNLYYGKKPENENAGGQQREAISAEFSDFINSFKNAYSTYKDAIQKGGTEMGLGYVRNDEQFQEMFGQFFNGVSGEQFQKLMNVKIGEKGDTTVGQTIQDKFLSGAEEGVLDFESAALAVASELEDYYNSEEGMKPYRKDYLNAAKELKRWVYSTVSKDNLTAALEEFEEGLKGITNTFENTNKSVETYRRLMEQGTAGDIGGQLGVSESEVLRPQSARQKDFISSYIAEFNNALGKFDGTTPFALSANALSSPTEVLKAIGKIDEVQRMNAGNFKSNELGSKSEQLKGMLKQLVDMMHQEMAGISGRAVSGTPMSNAIANTALGTKSSMFGFAGSQSVAGEYGLIDSAAIEKLLTSSKEQSTAFFDTFMKSEKGAMAADLLSGGIDKDAFFQKFDDAIYQLYTELGGTKMDDLHTKVQNGTATEEEKKQYNENIELIIPKTLKFELDLRKEDLGKSIDNFNAEGGKLGLGDEIRRYREAPEKYKKEYDDLTQRVTDTQTQRATAVSQMEQLQPAIKDGTATQEQIDQFNALQLEVANCDASLSQYNNRLTEIGENGSIAAAKEQMEALGDAQNKLNHFSKGFDSMQNAVIAVVDSLKACVDTFAKFYDIVNDGENPKWLTDIQEGMGNFIENFKTAVAPILAVVGAIIAVIVVVATLTTACATLEIAAWPLLVIMAALIAVAAIVAGIMTAIQAHDNNLEHSIEDLKKQVEEFEDAAERLNSVAERMTGIEKLKTQVDALGQSLSSASAYAEMARLEEEKKDTDEEKVKEYEKQAFEASEEFNNGIKGMLDELIGATEDWSSTMSDSIRSAFQNGDNAARSFRASIKEMMGDIVQSMLEMAILQPLIENALQEWTNSDALKQKYTKNVTKTDENGNQITVSEFDSEGYTEELLSNINDPEKAENAYNSMQNAGDAYIDAVENLPDFLNDAFKFNSDTSSLSGGISGITEDTARQLEGLSNSQLMQLILINRTLTQYLEAATTSSDNNQYMANVQTHLQQINNNVGLILRSITELRDTPSRPLHVTMV